MRKFVVSEDGGVDASIAQFVKWAMRSVAATFIFQSTLDTPLAMGAFVSASFLGFLVSKMIHKRYAYALLAFSFFYQSFGELARSLTEQYYCT